MDRRELLTTTGLAMAGWTTPIRRWLATPADPLAAHTGTMLRVGAADVAELLSAAEDARRWDSRYGGGNWRSSAILDCLRERAAPLLHGRLAADAVEIHRDLGLPAAAWRWNTEALMPTGTFARSHGLRLTVLACTHLQGQSPDLEAAIDQGNRAVLARVASARAADYVRDLLDRLQRWKPEPGVADLTHRIRRELTTA